MLQNNKEGKYHNATHRTATEADMINMIYTPYFSMMQKHGY